MSLSNPNALFADLNTRYKINIKPLVIHDGDAIQNAIFNCLFTPLMTRAWRPTFGSRLYYFLQEPCDGKTSQAIAADIRQTLNRWETRINISAVNVSPLPTGDGFYIQLFYTVIATKERSQTAFTVQK